MSDSPSINKREPVAVLAVGTGSRSETMVLADALDVLAKTTKTDDGVFNAAISEAAQRLREQEWEIAGLIGRIQGTIAALGGHHDNPWRTLDKAYAILTYANGGSQPRAL